MSEPSDQNEPASVDLVIHNACVITMDDNFRIIESGAVAVDRGKIVAVGEDSDIARRFVGRRRIDAGGAPVHPGFIECHMHASFQLTRGVMPDQLVEADAFGRFEADFFNAITDEEEYLAVLLSSIEMIRNGTTCFLEAGTVMEPTSAARAAEEVGIRAIIGDAFIWDQPQGLSQGDAACADCESAARAAPTLERAPRDYQEAVSRMGGQLFRNADPDALVTGHVVILGLGTASEKLMMEAKASADAAGVVLNLHQSYSPADTEADRRQYGGVDPLVHLQKIGFLDRNIVFGHANHLTDAECDAILDAGPSLAWAPAASMMWGRGSSVHGRHAELWRRGANIALGSDSPNWSNDFDIWRQANLAVMAARDVHEDRTFLVAEDGLYMATRGGAKACGMDDRIGSIEVGKRADIVIHTLDRPEMIPTTNMIRNLFYSSRSKSVHTVIVDGKVVLDSGRFAGFNETETLTAINDAAHALIRRAHKTVEPNRIERTVRGVCTSLSK